MGRGKAAKPGGSGGYSQNRSNAAKEKRTKKGGYSGEDFPALVQQLRPLGLSVRKMDPDGNCLFRAFADQFCGDCEEHQQFRDECCELMLDNMEEFELFHAEDEDEESLSFRAYVQRMRYPGCWGSQLELMALCRRHNVNAIIHQSGLPAFEMGNAPRNARCLQLSYHDGEHFNSVRFSWDLAPGEPAQHLSLEQLRGGNGEDGAEESEELREVREFLPPDQEVAATAIRAALARAEGSTSLAAEFLLADEFGGASGGGADADEAAAATFAGSAIASQPASTKDKKAQKRQSKKEKGAAQRKQNADEVEEKISLLGKQLLSV